MTDSSFGVSPEQIRQHADSTAQSYVDGARAAQSSFAGSAAVGTSLPPVLADSQSALDGLLQQLAEAAADAVATGERYQQGLVGSAQAYARTEAANTTLGRNVPQ